MSVTVDAKKQPPTRLVVGGRTSAGVIRAVEDTLIQPHSSKNGKPPQQIDYIRLHITDTGWFQLCHRQPYRSFLVVTVRSQKAIKRCTSSHNVWQDAQHMLSNKW